MHSTMKTEHLEENQIINETNIATNPHVYLNSHMNNLHNNYITPHWLFQPKMVLQNSNVNNEDSEENDEGLPSFEGAYFIDKKDLIFGEILGKGNFGTVYKGNFFGTPVAIKVIPKGKIEESVLKKFIQRELFISRFSHPILVQFIGICDDQESGEILLVSEYLSGGNLRNFLKNSNKNFPWTSRIQMARDVACGMAFLHSKRIIHRDLKNKNLLIGHDERIKICDFGLARKLRGERARAMTTHGTECWMAPEVIMGFEYDEKADIFSYGVVLLEIICRKKFDKILLATRTPESRFQIHFDDFKHSIPQDVPIHFLQLAMKCCEYDPIKRPTFMDIMAQLDSIHHSLKKTSSQTYHHNHHQRRASDASDQKPPLTQIQKPIPGRKNSAPPVWVPDENVPSCSNCQNQFTVFNRRHHCRSCGNIFCAKCSCWFIALPQFGFTKPVRVCAKCNSDIKNVSPSNMFDSTKLKTFKLANEKALKNAILTRFSSNASVVWVLLGYKQDNLLEFQNSGEGLETLLPNLHEDQIQYIFLGLTVDSQKGENYIKYQSRNVIIHWVGPKVPIMERGKKTFNLNQILDSFKHNIEITAISKSNFTLLTLTTISEPNSRSKIID